MSHKCETKNVRHIEYEIVLEYINDVDGVPIKYPKHPVLPSSGATDLHPHS